MTAWLLVPLLAALADSPQIEVEPLKGQRRSGQLVSLSADMLRLQSGDQILDVPLAEVIEIVHTRPVAPAGAPGPRALFTDGTKLACREFSVSRDRARLETVCCGEIEVATGRLSHVRLGISTTRLDEAWHALVVRESKNDLLVIRKDEVLDFLAGVTGDVGEKITFLLDGDEVPVARDKVYGIIFRRRAATQAKPVCRVLLAGGDELAAASVRYADNAFRVKLSAGPEVTLAADAVVSIDFSAGKLRYLSQLEPREVKYVPFFDLMREYRRDKSLDGTPLSLGGKSYARGIAIHSKTTLRYRIGGEFTRFQALLGIDDSVRRLGQVHVVISGDGKPLFDAEVKGTDPPRPLDLDVTDVRDLEILVDFGGDTLDIADHLDLAEARLLK